MVGLRPPLAARALETRRLSRRVLEALGHEAAVKPEAIAAGRVAAHHPSVWRERQAPLRSGTLLTHRMAIACGPVPFPWPRRHARRTAARPVASSKLARSHKPRCGGGSLRTAAHGRGLQGVAPSSCGVVEGASHTQGVVPLDPLPRISRVDENVALAPLDLFVRLVPTDPPFSVVLTDWLSIIPALG
jgi:hypothetical protein